MTRKNTHVAKQASTLFLKLTVLVLGLVILGICIFILPLVIILDETGYYPPLFYAMYITAIPFFMALYQAIKLLNYIDANKAFTGLSVRALKKIKHYAAVISVMYTAGMPYIYYVGDKDDAPGVIIVGLVIVFASLVITTAAGLFQHLFQNAVDIKNENDLTV